MENKLRENFINVITITFLGLIFLMLFMYIIRHILDNQTPSIENLIDAGKNEIMYLKFLGFNMKKIIFNIDSTGAFMIRVENYLSLYIMPIILSSISTAFISLIIKIIKKYTAKLKI